MASPACCFILLLVLLFGIRNSEANSSRRVYLVHVNEGSDREVETKSAHVEILGRVLEDGRKASESHIYSYKESFTGFAARLTDEERKKLEGMEEVLAVEPSRELKLQTTRSWDFLGFPIKGTPVPGNRESDVIVGVFDTGIWPDSESFRDDGLGPPPAKWKGACENIKCNNKIIGARSYYTGDRPLAEEKSVIDVDGHGTHVASTIAGRHVRNASFYGLGEGIARGGVPSARIAVYKVCWTFTNGTRCSEHDIVKAVEEAIQDGVDIISASLGSPELRKYDRDVLAIISFRTMKRGILTSASAGNFGPSPSILANVAPWILTVAASSTDRMFVGELELGNGLRIDEGSINAFPTQKSFYQIVYGQSSQLSQTGDSTPVSRTTKYKNANLIANLTGDAVEEASNSSARGLIAIEEVCGDLALVLPLPGICLTPQEAARVMKYVAETRVPKGKIHKSRAAFDQAAPAVLSLSSKGPSLVSPDILKPDISAPGVQILAAWSPKAAPATDFPLSDKRSSPFNILTGTSMSCPHASAIALYVKAHHPSWSPAAIKSALMTTAKPMSPAKNPEAEFAYGSGQLNPLQAINPGLVYDTTEADYINFLCIEGYSVRSIRHIAGDNNISCPNTSNFTTKDLNYPSMSAKVPPDQKFRVQFKRTVTNFGSPNSFYVARIKAPTGLSVEVTPSKLLFGSLQEKMDFFVEVSGKALTQGSKLSASLIWLDQIHVVRSPILIYAL